MDEFYVMELLDELERLLEGSKAPFGSPSRRTIELNDALGLIDEIRDSLPRELTEARKVVHMRQEKLAQADQEAASIIDDAERQAANIASEQEIARLAQQEHDRIISEAQDAANEVRYGAFTYADNMLAQLSRSFEDLSGDVNGLLSQFSAELSKRTDEVERVRQSLSDNHQP